MKTLIFEKPSLRPLPNRIGWAFFTTLFWLVWLYLWMPVITLAFWLLGLHFLDQYFLRPPLGDLATVRHLIYFYLVVVIFLGGSLLTWAGTEFVRFHNVHKRHRPLPVGTIELANHASTSVETMTEIVATRRMIVHHDENGKFLHVELGGKSA